MTIETVMFAANGLALAGFVGYTAWRARRQETAWKGLKEIMASLPGAMEELDASVKVFSTAAAELGVAADEANGFLAEDLRHRERLMAERRIVTRPRP